MEDSKIIDLYWARSEEAIAQTQVKYGSYCLSIAHNILPRREDAQECVNDTYLAAWNSMPPHRPSILQAFLGKLTRRISIDRWRSITSQKRGGGNMDLAYEELSECIPAQSDPVARLEARELALAINRYLDALPDIQRQIFLMRYFRMEPIGHIARATARSEAYVKTTLHRVRNRLRDHLQKEGY